MKKELVVFVNSNEEGEAIRISRVDDGTNRYMLLSLGTNRMVVDVEELMDGLGAIGHYSTLFDQEERMKAMRAKTQSSQQAPVARTNPIQKEEEFTFVMDAPLRTGPSASEIALEAQTRHMQGDSFILKEK
jgi:hypothetical protein